MLWLAVLIFGGMARAVVPAARLARLRHGLNMAHLFRYPPDPPPRALARGVPTGTLDVIHAAGFDFLPCLCGPTSWRDGQGGVPWVVRQRILGSGLAVIVVPADPRWRLNDPGLDEKQIACFWRQVASMLARFGPARVFPEIDNEPVLTDHGA